MTTNQAAIKTVAQLLAHDLVLPQSHEDLDQPESLAGQEALERVAAEFAITISPAMVSLIDREAPDDPIARQFVPQALELLPHPDDRSDPIGDDKFEVLPGLIHRYRDRVLLKPIETCAVYCRFCFRRETVNQSPQLLEGEALDRVIDYIAQHAEIWEVILSGGDPLLLSPRRMGEIVERLAAIPHVKILRLHSRIPVVAPEKITAELLQSLQSRLTVYLLLHCNHPRELTDAAGAAIARIVQSAIPILGQSVLLRGVNDSIETLTALFRRMVELRITPHYLHHPDLTRGTAHFRLPISVGQELVRAMRGPVSGLCQPHYMLDIPGGAGKVPIAQNWINTIPNHPEHYRVTAPDGFDYTYPSAL